MSSIRLEVWVTVTAAIIACMLAMAGVLWGWALDTLLDHERRITELEQVTHESRR